MIVRPEIFLTDTIADFVSEVVVELGVHIKDKKRWAGLLHHQSLSLEYTQVL